MEKREGQIKCFNELRSKGLFSAFKTYEEWEVNKEVMEKAKHGKKHDIIKDDSTHINVNS